MARDVFHSIEDLETYMTGYGDGISRERATILVPLVASGLKKNIQHHIDQYYAEGYMSESSLGLYELSGTGYTRTNKLKKSLDNVSFNVTGSSLKSSREVSCEFTFDEDMAKSESIFNTNKKTYPQYDGNRIDLIQGGWKVESDNVWFKDVWHMGYYEGYDFIGKAIDDTLAQIREDEKDMIDIYVTGARNVSASSPRVHIR